MRLRGPTGDYQTITASSKCGASGTDECFATADPQHGTGYAAYANVTDTVKSLGQGLWTGANVASATGMDMFAGWSLVIAYSNPDDPLRDLTVFQGFAVVTDKGPETVHLTINGFVAPKTGPVGAEIGVVAGEGDMAITGDSMQVNSTYLADKANPWDNFFNSQDTVDGVPNTARDPGNLNMLGWDLKQVAAPDAIANGDTSASVTLSTVGDTYYPSAISTQLDLYAPDFASPAKSVVDVTGYVPKGCAPPVAPTCVAQVGHTLLYTLTFTNIGQDAAQNLVLHDPIPANTAYLPGTLYILTGANADPNKAKTDNPGDDQAEFDKTNNQVVFRLGDGADATHGGTLAPTDKTSVSFEVTVQPGAEGTTVKNQGLLDYTAATLGGSFTYRTNEVDTPVGGQADLSIIKKVTPGTPAVAPGGELQYTLLAQNNGPSTAVDATVADALPTGTTFVSADVTSGTGSCTPLAVGATGTVTCALGDMASGATAAITLTVKLNLDFSGDSVTNTGTISSNTFDPNLTNNTSTVVTDVGAEADMAITKTGPPNVHAGDEVTYTLVATNNGPSDALAPLVVDQLPSGTTFVSSTPGVPTCSEVSPGRISCNFGTMAPHDTQPITIVARVDPSTPTGTTITNYAWAGSNTPDPNFDNNLANATSNVYTKADVAITKSASPGTFVPGEPASYTLTADNHGPSDAQDVHVTDDLPAGLTYVNASPSQGTPCTETAGKVDCALGTLPAGTSATVTINVTVDPSVTGSIRNTGKVSSTTPDPDRNNNSSTIDTPVAPSADVAIAKLGYPNPVTAGNTLTYTLGVINHGPSDAQDVKVSDPLPPQVTYQSLTSTAGTTCSEASGTVSCDLGTLVVGGTATIVIVTAAHPGLPPNAFTNTADVSSATPDPDRSNNSADFISNLLLSADMVLTKTASPKPVIAGNDLTYTLEAANNGPSLARGVTVSDPLPAATTFVSAEVMSGSGSCTGPPWGPRGQSPVRSATSGWAPRSPSSSP